MSGDPQDAPRGEIGPRLWLKRADQGTTAALVCLAMLLLAFYWWRQGGLTGRLLDVEHLPRRTAGFQVDINTASWIELSQIPEIGETLAKRIVAHRERHGPFQQWEDLLQVPGIGSRTLERMRPALRSLAKAPDAP